MITRAYQLDISVGNENIKSNKNTRQTDVLKIRKGSIKIDP
jgi:hypothetical protein